MDDVRTECIEKYQYAGNNHTIAYILVQNKRRVPLNAIERSIVTRIVKPKYTRHTP